MASIVGLYDGEDISLGDTVFNKISDDQCAWAITDLEGWWGLPDVDVADDPKTQSLDGSYYTFGRYLPRTISLRGQIIPLDGAANKAVAARGTLNRALAPLARSRVLLSVEEDDPKVALVQLAGTPLTRIDKTTGQMTFDIVLRAVDPVKYSSMLHTDSTTLASTAPGRTYNKTFYYSYGGKTTSGVIGATNIGSYQSDAIFTITGPVTRPRIEHVEQGVYLEFNVVLGIGETLTINTRTKKILFAGASRRNTLTPGSRWFSLSPGLNTIRYSGTQQIPAQVELPAGINRITNPSMETTTGTVEVRRNYATNAIPNVATDYSYSTGSEVSSTTLVSGVTDGPIPTVSRYLRRTVTTAQTSSAVKGFFSYDKASMPPAIGDTGVASVYVRSSHALTISLNVGWRNSSNASVGTQTNGPSITLVPGEWTRLTAPAATAVSGAVSLGWWAVVAASSALPAGGTLDTTAVLVEKNMPVGAYFDGTFTPDSDLTSVWDGAVNASASVLRAPGVATVSTGSPTLAARFSSSSWSASVGKSLRISPRQSSGLPVDSYAAIPLTGLVIGSVYTVLGTVRLTEAQTGTLSTELYAPARGFWLSGVASTDAAGRPTYYSLAQNMVGIYEVRATFTAIAATGELRLMNGALPGGGDVWWDNVMLVEGNYTGDYFDGSFPYASWAGTPNASTSSRPYVPAVPETMLQLSYRDAWID